VAARIKEPDSPARPNRQRFELLPADGDQRAAVDGLFALGATRPEARDNSTVIVANPDGNEFCVRPNGHHPTGSPPQPGTAAALRAAHRGSLRTLQLAELPHMPPTGCPTGCTLMPVRGRYVTLLLVRVLRSHPRRPRERAVNMSDA